MKIIEYPESGHFAQVGHDGAWEIHKDGKVLQTGQAANFGAALMAAEAAVKGMVEPEAVTPTVPLTSVAVDSPTDVKAVRPADISGLPRPEKKKVVKVVAKKPAARKK